MKKLNNILVLVFLLLQAAPAFAQTTDEQLAAQYYQNKEYDKAVIYYEKLFNKKPIPLYYNYYLNCLLELKDYKTAEKVVKKQIKKNEKALNFLVDLGFVYAASGDEGKAKDQYSLALKELTEQQQVFELAKAFVAIKEYDYAIEAYEKGRKLSKGSYPYNFEIASVYELKGDLEKAVAEYLDVLLMSDNYLESVQNALQPSFGENANQKKNDLIKAELIKRIQKYQDKTVYSELLIWMFMQQRDFESAFTQAKALDKRLKEDGKRIMDLGAICASNDKLDVAVKCYEYVLSKGKENYYYVQARMELLNVMYRKIVTQGNYQPAELLALENNYKAALEELGKYSGTVIIMKNLAHLQAFYLNNLDGATALLEEAINMPGVSEVNQADCKLEMADILLMTGDIWEASLLYSQVEKAFKDDPIGHEAKFRNARLSYYIGDFQWALSQLTVLKGATTKLIANDAMELSLMINDNLVMDTVGTALRMFARAQLLSFRNQDSLALVTLDSINKEFPSHALADDILYQRYKIKMRQGKPEEGIVFLHKIADDHGEDLLGDDALFYLGEIYENRLNDLEKAKKYYEELLLKHPDSLYTVEARKRYRKLRGDNVN
ncbi:MAG: tetratricopeptide repeat protein [Bacteroidota bacterium]